MMFEEAKFEDGDTEQLTYKVYPWKPPLDIRDGG
jgi:hypothetical protein